MLSRFFYGHTLGQLYRGLTGRLDESRFEIVVIHLPRSKQDFARADIDGLASQVVTLPSDLASKQHQLGEVAPALGRDEPRRLALRLENLSGGAATATVLGEHLIEG